MGEEQDPIVDSEVGSDSEVEVLRRSLGFNSFKLSEKPGWDLKRKMVLARILPLLFCGKTYDEISAELHVARCQVYEILKIYYQAADQNGFVDMHWWDLFLWAKKNKPELALNVLTQIKLKKMALTAPTQTEEIVVKWVKDEQDTGNNDQLPSEMGSEASARQLCKVQDAPLRAKMGQDNVGSK